MGIVQGIERARARWEEFNRVDSYGNSEASSLLGIALIAVLLPLTRVGEVADMAIGKMAKYRATRRAAEFLARRMDRRLSQ